MTITRRGFMAGGLALTAAALTPTAAQAVITPKIAAHRGCVGIPGIQENTLEAFAWGARYASMIDADVRWTADNRMILHHDSTFRGEPVSSYTLEELKSQGLTSLYQMLDWARSNTKLINLEIKNKGLSSTRAKQFVRNIVDRGLTTRVKANSFDTATLQAVRTVKPTALATGLVTSQPLGSNAQIRRYGTWVYPKYTVLTAAKAASLRAYGIKVGVWTAANSGLFDDCFNDQADYVFADNAKQFQEWLVSR